MAKGANAVVIGLGAVACFAALLPQRLAGEERNPAAQPAALVNGKPIPVAQVQELAEEIAKSAGTTVEQVWKDALEQLISAELLVQEAKATGTSVTEAEVEQEIRDLAALGSGHPLAEWLRTTPAARVRDEIRRSLLVEKLLTQSIRVNIERKQVEEYYEQHKERFQRPPMVRASHILIKIQGDNRAAAEQRAKELLARVKGGEDFASLARQFSEDPLTKEKGGDLGFFPQHPTPLAQAAFHLQDGEVSEIIESPYGLHILKVTGRRPAGIAPLEEVFDEIREMLEEDAREDREEQLIEALRAKAKIQLLRENPPGAPEQPPLKR